MTDVDYVSLQALREEAGMQKYKNGETPSGTANGSNKVFTVAKKPLVDQDGDDILSGTDVVAYVNGAPVNVSSINAAAGSISLTAAPANGAAVTVDYAYSPLSDAQMEVYRTRAQKWLERRVKNVWDLSQLTVNNVPDEWTNMALLYGAGLILIKDYGSSADTDGTSKDGYKKLGLARELMTEYLSDQSEDKDVTAISPETASSRNDGDIFHRDTMLEGDSASRDDRFMRDEREFI